MIGLSILIPTLPVRAPFFERIIDQLKPQMQFVHDLTGMEIEVRSNDQTDISIGVKRNILLQNAQGGYVCFIDDDDRVSEDYVRLVVAGILQNPDCCSLTGVITTDGKNPKLFRHSIDYKEMYEADGIYYRPPNHLNTVRASIAKQMVFPDWQRSEDSNYCFQLRDSGLLKVEYKINPVLYYYDYVSDKKY